MEHRERPRPVGARWFGFAAVTLLWFDVFLYSATVAVMGETFLPAGDRAWAGVIALSSIGVTVLFRPWGALLGGWLADRWGRRPVALLALAAGAVTAVLALLPPYAAIGAVAPVMVLVVRALQGLAAGAIWPSFVVLVVESAPQGRRATDGALCQAGVPAGLLLCLGSIWMAQSVTTPAGYADWGWRLPSLLALGLALLAIWGLSFGGLRESPVFERLRSQQRVCRRPFVHAVRSGWASILGIAVVTVVANMLSVVMLGGFISAFVEGLDAGLSWVDGQLALAFGATIWLATVLVGGPLADRLGARRVLLFSLVFLTASSLPFVSLLETASLLSIYAAMVLIGVGAGLCTASRPAFVVGRFVAAHRGAGVGIGTGLGALSGVITNALVERASTGQAGAMWQLGITMGLCLLATAGAVALMRGPAKDDYCALGGCVTSDSEHPLPSPSAHPS